MEWLTEILKSTEHSNGSNLLTRVCDELAVRMVVCREFEFKISSVTENCFEISAPPAPPVYNQLC